MEFTKDLKNKQLVKRLIKLSQPKKDISKIFKGDEDKKKYYLDTEEVDTQALPFDNSEDFSLPLKED